MKFHISTLESVDALAHKSAKEADKLRERAKEKFERERTLDELLEEVDTINEKTSARGDYRYNSSNYSDNETDTERQIRQAKEELEERIKSLERRCAMSNKLNEFVFEKLMEAKVIEKFQIAEQIVNMIDNPFEDEINIEIKD